MLDAKDVKLLISDLKEYISAVESCDIESKDFPTLAWLAGNRIRMDFKALLSPQEVEIFCGMIISEIGDEYPVISDSDMIFDMVRMAEIIPDSRSVSDLSSQMAWLHFKEIFDIEEDLERVFYCGQCKSESWTVAELAKKISQDFYSESIKK